MAVDTQLIGSYPDSTEARFLQQAMDQVSTDFAQGHLCCTARGKAIGGATSRWHGPRLQYLKAALEDYPKHKNDAVFREEKKAGHEDLYSQLRPPEGIAVVNVAMKMIGDFKPPITVDMGPQENVFGCGEAADCLWIRKDELESLAKAAWPDSLSRRLAEYHLYDTTRGQTGSKARWPDGGIRNVEVTITQGRLTGKVHLETANGDRGYKADLLGFIETKGGKLTRFDMVVKGWWHNDWWFDYCGQKVPPRTQRTLAIAFTLNNDKDERRLLPPGQAYRGVDVYLFN